MSMLTQKCILQQGADINMDAEDIRPHIAETHHASLDLSKWIKLATSSGLLLNHLFI